MVRCGQGGMAGKIKQHSERAYRFYFNQYALSELLIQWTLPPYSVFWFSFLPFHLSCFPRFSCTQCTVTLWQIPLQQSVTLFVYCTFCLEPLLFMKFFNGRCCSLFLYCDFIILYALLFVNAIFSFFKYFFEIIYLHLYCLIILSFCHYTQNRKTIS